MAQLGMEGLEKKNNERRRNSILRDVKGEKLTEQMPKSKQKNRNATTHKILRIHAERIAREKGDL